MTTAAVAAGTYNVYAYFWSDNSNTWRLRADFADQVGDLPLYLPGGAGVTQFYTGADATVLSSTLTPNPFTTSVMIAEGNRRLYQVALGQSIAATNLRVFIDDMGPAQTLQSDARGMRASAMSWFPNRRVSQCWRCQRQLLRFRVAVKSLRKAESASTRSRIPFQNNLRRLNGPPAGWL